MKVDITNILNTNKNTTTMNFTDCINALQEYAAAPEDAGVDNEFFINVVKFVKEQEEQIKLQVCMKENENTKRIKLERENKELRDEVKRLQKEDDVLEDTLSSLNFYQEQCKELKDEIKELKKEITRVQRETTELLQGMLAATEQLKDEVAGWSPTSSAEPRMPD